MAQISFEDLVNGTVPDASDFNSRLNALKNRINNGMETDNIANSSVTTAKIANDAVDATKLDVSDDYTWTGTHDYSGATVTGIGVDSPAGTFKNLRILRASAATVDIDIDGIVVTDGTDTALLKAVDLTVDISTGTGANTLDTGSEANSTWYYIWVIYNGTTTAGLLSTASTIGSVTLPSGYTKYALVGAVFNDGSGNFIDFDQYGNIAYYDTWRSMVTGSASTSTSIDTTSFVPSGVSNIAFGGIEGQVNAIGMVSNKTISAAHTATGKTNTFENYMNETSGVTAWDLNIITANTLYYKVGGGSNTTILIAGYKLNKI